jgi:GT2 family glycosyltransferase
MSKAPIAFFTYNRPEHTCQSLRSLAENPEARESELFIFCDAPKKTEHKKGVDEVRHIVRSRQWCGSVHIIEHEENMGCAASVIEGVTQVCEASGRIIVIEDDLVLSPHFLEYMNAALDLYESTDQVVQISGYMFPLEFAVETDAFFLPFTTSWGWATWQRAWIYFDPEMTGFDILKNHDELRYSFNIGGTYDYFGMLEQQRAGKVDSWAIRWYLSTFLKNGVTLYPRKTLVENGGFDGSGTHYRLASGMQAPDTPDFQVLSYPSEILARMDFAWRIGEYLKQPRQAQGSILTRLRRLLRKP